MSRSVCQRKIIRELARDHQVEHLDDVLLGIKCVSLVDINIDVFFFGKTLSTTTACCYEIPRNLSLQSTYFR